MTGVELYTKLSKRDYSGSDQDQYAQFLSTIHFQAQVHNELDKFFSLLESAEKSNKKLDVNDSELEEIFMDSLVLV